MILPNPVAFHIFDHPIYWYGILVAVAVLTAILMCMYRAKNIGLTGDNIMDLALFIIPSAIIGARLYYVIFSWSDFASNPIRILFVWEGGLAFYGGVIGAVVAGVVCCRVKKIKLLPLMDLVAPALAIGQAIGRWGNFVNQEAFGAQITNTSMQFFPVAVYIERSNSWHMATFFYESLACLMIGLFLLWFSRRRPQAPAGSAALFYGLLYGIERGFVEGLRTDSLYLGDMRISQVLSILLAVACGALLVRIWLKRREPVVEIDPNLVMRRSIQEEDEEDLAAPDQEPSAPPSPADQADPQQTMKEGE